MNESQKEMISSAVQAQNERAAQAIESARLSTANITAIVSVVLNAVQSDETKRAYERALMDFIEWYQEQGEPAFAKATVQRYLAYLRDDLSMGASAINQRRSAINKLVREAVDNNAMPEQAANGILRIEGIKREGVRMGNWLTKEQAQELISAPDVSTLKGLRDRAIISVALGCGLRRKEIASLTFEHVQQRDGRWVLVDIIGKRNKVRSVPMPSWAKVAIDEYAERAGLSDGLIFRRINKGDKLAGQSITAQAIYDVLKYYSYQLWSDEGVIAAHDTRRTYAHLALKGGAPIEQISLTLGHESIETTQRYLGVQLDLTDAPCDKLGLRLE